MLKFPDLELFASTAEELGFLTYQLLDKRNSTEFCTWDYLLCIISYTVQQQFTAPSDHTQHKLQCVLCIYCSYFRAWEVHCGRQKECYFNCSRL